MRTATRAILTIVLWIPASAQTQPGAKEIMDRVARTYAAATEWDLASTFAIQLDQRSQVITLRYAGKGIKRRMETEMGTAGLVLIIADGENLWSYSARANEYTKTPWSRDGSAEAHPYLAIPLFLYKSPPDGVSDIKLLREETIPVGSTKVDCYVIQFHEARPSSIRTWWVDKRRFVVVRDDTDGPDPTYRGSMVWTSSRINEPVSDDLFVFTPPPGAQQQARIAP